MPSTWATNYVICVVGPSSAVVAAGHDCGRDGLIPSGRRSFRSGSEVDDDNPKPSWHRPKRHGTELGDGGTSVSTLPAGRASDEARCAVSSTGGRWQLDVLPDLLPPFSELLEREKTKTACVVGRKSSLNEQA